MSKHEHLTHEPSTHTHVEGEYEPKNLKAVIIALAITVLLQVITNIVYTYNSMEDRKSHAIQGSLNRQFKILQGEYKEIDNKYEEIDGPLISLRNTLEEIENVCLNIDKISSQEQASKLDQLIKERRQYKVALVKANRSSDLVFGKQLYNQINLFIAKVEQQESLTRHQLCLSNNKLVISKEGEGFIADTIMEKKLREISAKRHEIAHKIEE